MKLAEAIELAEKDENVRKLKGYFLVSCFAIIKDNNIDEWILHYLNPNSKKIVDCFVGSDVKIGEAMPATGKMDRLEMKNIKISDEQALKKIKKTGQVLMVLHKKKLWTVNVIGKNLSVTSYDIDAETGKIVREETSSLVKIL